MTKYTSFFRYKSSDGQRSRVACRFFFKERVAQCRITESPRRDVNESADAFKMWGVQRVVDELGPETGLPGETAGSSSENKTHSVWITEGSQREVDV